MAEAPIRSIRGLVEVHGGVRTAEWIVSIVGLAGGLVLVIAAVRFRNRLNLTRVLIQAGLMIGFGLVVLSNAVGRSWRIAGLVGDLIVIFAAAVLLAKGVESLGGKPPTA
jgi:hypothetical protein